jgi:hypothetical protein
VYKNIRPSQAILDPDNPRLPDGTSGDVEAINRLLQDDPDDLIRLARDIARRGTTNPSELPIAIKAGTKYLILEGNRRFAALRLLKDPKLAMDSEHRKAFQRAAALGTPPSVVHTLVASSREEADHWIVLRHTGANNGVGVKRWNTAQAATHRRRANRSVESGTNRSLIIANELEEAYISEPVLLDLIRRVRREKLTNIGRLFSSDVLVKLSLTIQRERTSELQTHVLLGKHHVEHLRDFFVWAFSFIDNNSVDAYKNADVRKLALKPVEDLLPSPSDATQEYFRLADFPYGGGAGDSGLESGIDDSAGEDEGLGDDTDPSDSNLDEFDAGGEATAAGDDQNNIEDGNEGGTPSSSPRRPAKPDQFLFQGLRVPRHPDRIRRLLAECQKIDMSQQAGIACVMVRVVVELSVSSPEALALSHSKESNSLKDKIIGMLRYLDPDVEHPFKRDKQLAQSYFEASSLGVQYLNAFVHNTSVYPDQHLARRFSDAFKPLLVRIDEVL